MTRWRAELAAAMRESRLTDDYRVSAIGLGCSSMSHGYGPTERNDAESARVIARAVELGITLFDTADVYGPFRNEQLLGRALRPYQRRVAIATKCGLVAGPDGRFSRNGRPEHVRAACEGSLRRLQTDTIDLYQLHRIDPAVPLEETWGALADLVAEGKVRRLGISHATTEELSRAHAVFPITAVQGELSVWAADSRHDILPWCRRERVGFLAFCPLGRGFLTGTVDHRELHPADSRVRDPRFGPDAVGRNWAIVEGLRVVAARHGATTAQVAIAWVMAQGDAVVPIPGTRKRRWLEENAAAADLRLTAEDLRDINRLPPTTGRMVWDRHRSRQPARTG